MHCFVIVSTIVSKYFLTQVIVSMLCVQIWNDDAESVSMKINALSLY